MSLSVFLIPALSLPAASSKRTFDSSHKPGTPVSHISTQWRHAYNLGKKVAPFLCLVSGSAYAYLSHAFRQETPLRLPDRTTSNWYLLALTLAIAPIPYTLTVMRSTNKSLMQRAEAADTESAAATQAKDAKGDLKASREEVEVQNLLKQWGEMNCVRGMFPLAATAVAVYATLF